MYTCVCVSVHVYIDACVFRLIYVYMLEIAYMYPARTGSDGKPAQADQPDRPDATRSVDVRYACCNPHNTRWVDCKPVQTEQPLPARHSHAHRRHGCTAAQRVSAGLGEHM